mmetsp:Transcript_33400/g.108078  ORF Transcript_33400/g.108078 Transcript_33400/m.108078 type:complete len:206 (-) Transcript_33400:13-630(-)
MVLGRHPELLVQPSHEARHGRFAHARVAGKHHVANAVHRAVPFGSPADVERELLAKLPHLLLHRLHADELRQRLVHLCLGSRQLLFGERAGINLILVVVRFLLLPTAPRLRLRLAFTLAAQPVLECLSPLNVLFTLVPDGIDRYLVLLVLNCCLQESNRLDVLVDGILVVSRVVRGHCFIGDIDAPVSQVGGHVDSCRRTWEGAD